LEFQVLIGGQEDIETSCRQCEQLTVLDARPAAASDGLDGMPGKSRP
jgi:hypothetical protein